jgi:hypothetical protein
MNSKLLFGCLLVLGALSSGCGRPKYTWYNSKAGDYRAGVPYEWHFRTENYGTEFSNTVFVGPFEPKFYLGLPTFQVRWYQNYRPHTLPDGSVEVYSGPDNFIEQTLSLVYDYPKKALLTQEIHEVDVAGRQGKHFVVQSEHEVHKNTRFGMFQSPDGRFVVMRKHGYVVVPAGDGFYVLIYPATREGYDKWEPAFNQFVNSFQIFKNGPGAPAPKSAAR